MIEMKIVDIVQPDICYLGGMTRTLRVAKMAEDENIPCTPHCAKHQTARRFVELLLTAERRNMEMCLFLMQNPQM